MKKHSIVLLLFLALQYTSAQEVPTTHQSSLWSYDIGFSFFKSSIRNQPDELIYNPVFTKWESINQQKDKFQVSEYTALDPYPFNLSVGVDALIRYKKNFMIKIGYCYSNTLGIGGRGNISYVDLSNGMSISDSKVISFTSHQINYFIGPTVPLDDVGSEVYMGFSPMSLTFVSYTEEFTRKENGAIVRDYNKTFNGFFGNCRTVIGMQVPLTERWKFGSELVFAYFNGVEVKSGDLVDEGFRFHDMQWNFTFRYLMK